MCNLHWCYTFRTGVTLFALVLQLNCTALSQSESSNFLMYIIIIVIIIIIIIITRKAPGALTPPLFSPLVSSTTGTLTLLSSISTQLPPRNFLRRLHHQTQPRVCPLIGQRVHTCVLGLVAQLIERR